MTDMYVRICINSTFKNSIFTDSTDSQKQTISYIAGVTLLTLDNVENFVVKRDDILSKKNILNS